MILQLLKIEVEYKNHLFERFQRKDSFEWAHIKDGYIVDWMPDDVTSEELEEEWRKNMIAMLSSGYEKIIDSTSHPLSGTLEKVEMNRNWDSKVQEEVNNDFNERFKEEGYD